MSGVKRGQTLGQGDLNVFFYNGGNLSDPFSVSYSIFDSTTGSDVLIGLANRTPIKFATGSFYAPWSVPDDEPIGVHKIKWEYKDSATSVVKIDTEEFEIINRASATGFEFPDLILYLIKNLRIKLRDINPDRDYHFSPPSSEQRIGGFTETRGFRWPDEQLYYHLVQAANYINLIPPDTDYSLESYPAPWQSLLLLQAMSYALWDLSILWINEEFNYSLNGISLDISRSDKYQSAAQALQDQVNTQTELAKKRIHITKGLGQSRFVFARGAALGPWCLHEDAIVYDLDGNEKITIKEAYERKISKSYSVDFNTGELIENEVVKIWSNGVQEIYSMKIEGGKSIKCTRTHKFFDKYYNEIELQNLAIGQEIWVKNNGILELERIESKIIIGDFNTFDMEMKDPHRNYIADDILVHNTGGQNIRRWVGSGSGSGLGF